MSDSSAAAGLVVQQWDAKFWLEYVIQNLFKKYMGKSMNSVIQVKEDLKKKKGDKITFALVNSLSGAGITGSSTLEGNEEDMTSRSHYVTVDKLRNAVRVSEMNEQKSAIPLRNAGKAVLKDWIMEKTRDQIIDALGSVLGVVYASATETNKDIWLVDNADRVLFGAAKSNNAANDHSACLAEIDATNDMLTPAAVSLMKRIALTATPKIRPIRIKNDEKWYVMFVNSMTFRDLKNNSVMVQANREAWQRGKENPLFSGGDLIWDGVVIKEVEDIAVTGAVGASSAVVGPAYLCGAQAIGIAWAKKTTSVTEQFDYGDKHGVAIEEIRGIEKLTFGTGSADTDDLTDNGMVTGFFSAAADT